MTAPDRGGGGSWRTGKEQQSEAACDPVQPDAAGGHEAFKQRPQADLLMFTDDAEAGSYRRLRH